MLFTFVLSYIVLSSYSDGPTEKFVKSQATGGDGSEGQPFGSINDAYTSFTDPNTEGFVITIIKEEDEAPKLKPNPITLSMDYQITIKGQITDEQNPEKISIDCSSTVGNDLLKCEKTVSFASLKFVYKATLGTSTGTLSLIHAVSTGDTPAVLPVLSIISCEFDRPTEETSIHLVKADAGTVNMVSVVSNDNTKTAKFSVTPFLLEGVSSVSMTGCGFGKMESSASAVVIIKNTKKIQVTLDTCTFTECKSTVAAASETSGALYVESDATDSEFTIGNTGATTFTSCTCEHGKSGAIYLNMKNIADAEKLKWPGTETNLVFTTCTIGAADASKNTSIYLYVPTTLHEGIANAMKASFAAKYDRVAHKDYIMARKTETENIDLVSEYINPEPKQVKTFYVKSGAAEGDGSDTKPWANIKEAYDHFTEASEGGYCIEIMKTDGQGEALVAEVNTFNKATGVTIEGYLDNAQSEKAVEVNCASRKGTEGKDLFTCKKAVSFKKLKMTFPLTFEKKETGKDYIANIHVVNVDAGAVSMNDVKCTGAEELTFSVTPFKVEGVTSVSLTLLNIEKLNSKQSAVMKVVGKADEVVTVVIDRCTFSNCISSDESTATSGALHVECENKGSKFSVKDKSATSFSSCSCTKGKSGALYLKMANIEKANQLSWPETKTDDNFKFTTCTAGEGDNEKSTGIYLDVPVALHKDIADTMKAGFATGYVRGTNDWNIVANSEDGDVDFTSKYFNPAIAYVKKDGSGNGETYETPMGSIINAYNGLVAKPSISGYVIKVIKEEDDKKILK
eukprot:MONOS_16450.1-p1 / transcript=MONOS_16450.1 / gene=MONOS_16450 / organism=Monocercomonoides_exilis_PA203 / gene_product=unspecified product / transcript_product=unspecified product / location=Mono_scaffold01748:2196-5370(+) / protein_length=794 / sequence_SO=supercontig / SO=protein_coding / is_pseudo=false